jgi:hypothetical protein
MRMHLQWYHSSQPSHRIMSPFSSEVLHTQYSCSSSLREGSCSLSSDKDKASSGVVELDSIGARTGFLGRKGWAYWRLVRVSPFCGCFWGEFAFFFFSGSAALLGF